MVHVLFPAVRALREQLSGEKEQPGFPTVGGSTGLFGSSGSLLEFGLAVEDDVRAVTVRVQAELVHVAVPFWDRFSSLTAVLAAAEANDPWLPPEPSWVIDLAAVTCILRGREAAIDLLRTRAPFLGSPRTAEVITRLSSLPEPFSFRRTKRT